MYLVIFILSLCVLAVLGARYGVDSRDLGILADEDHFARLGMTWGRSVATPKLHALRHPLAAALYRLAQWLAPEMARAAR